MGFFIKKTGGNNYGGRLFGFGSGQWGKPGLTVDLPYGVLAVKVGKGAQVRSKKHTRIPIGNLAHVALTVDSQANFILYVDGEQIIEGKGEVLDDYGVFQAMAFSGPEKEGILMDELKILYRPLSSAEVKKGNPPENSISFKNFS